MYRFSLASRCRLLLGVVLASVVLNLAAVGSETTQHVPLPADWTDGPALLSKGQFDEAEPIIAKIASARGSSPRIAAWLKEYEGFQAERRERIRQTYDLYAGWAAEDMEGFREGDQKSLRGWWWYAARDAAKAFQYTDDEDVFRKEPWLKKLVTGSLKAAVEFEEAEEWIEAATIYARLKDLFPFNADYREALKRCQSHIRLDLTYTSDAEWEDEVEDIVSEMAIDAFRKIQTDMLRAVSFRHMAVKGLEQVLRLTEAALDDVFTVLADEDSVEEFVDRVTIHLERVRNNEEATVEDLEDAMLAVLRINRQTRVLPEEVVVYEFVQGALQPVDRFSNMIWPAEVEEFTKLTQGKFCGVGIQIHKAPGKPILVISPLKDSPAYDAGVWAGDLITRINGEPAAEYTSKQAVDEITGRSGTTVHLAFQRNDHEFELDLERREVIISATKGIERIENEEWTFMLDPELKIGYVRVTNFTDETGDQLEAVITRLVDTEQMRGLILDLRGNPGGLLKAATDVSKLFLADRKKIVTTKGRRGEPWRLHSDEEAPFSDFPMIVLINPASASASEIVAGALQVHKRALIVGERSFGKGSVQEVHPLTSSRNAYLKLTTSLYYLPNGRCLHRDEDSVTWGVDPDVEVKLVPKEESKIRQLQLRADILKGNGQDRLTEKDIKRVTEYWPSAQANDRTDGDADMPDVDRTDENNFPEIDPQLQAAHLLMRVRLESQQPWPIETTEVAAKKEHEKKAG